MELCSRYYNLEGYAPDGDDYEAELARDADRRVNAVEAEAKALLREVIPDFDRLVAEAFVEVEAAT